MTLVAVAGLFTFVVSECFFFFFWFSIFFQRKLQIPLLWHPCEARFTTQQTPRRHAVHGPQTAAGPAETEVGIIIFVIIFISLFVHLPIHFTYSSYF